MGRQKSLLSHTKADNAASGYQDLSLSIKPKYKIILTLNMGASRVFYLYFVWQFCNIVTFVLHFADNPCQPGAILLWFELKDFIY